MLHKAMDCYEMGKHWYERTEFPLAQSWFNQALLKIADGDSTVQQELVSSHLYLAVAFSGMFWRPTDSDVQFYSTNTFFLQFNIS